MSGTRFNGVPENAERIIGVCYQHKIKNHFLCYRTYIQPVTRFLLERLSCTFTYAVDVLFTLNTAAMFFVPKIRSTPMRAIVLVIQFLVMVMSMVSSLSCRRTTADATVCANGY